MSRAMAIVVIGPRQIGKPTMVRDRMDFFSIDIS